MPEVTVNGVQLVYEIHAAAGTPVLLLGGTGMPGFVWRAGPVDALRGAGFRPVTVDGRGVGASSAPLGPYSIEDLAEDSAALITHLALGPVHLVGMSQGGFIAEHLAVTRPELLASATLIASAGPTAAYTRAWATAWRDLLHARHDIPASMFVLDDLLGLPARVLRDDDTTVGNWLTLLSAQADFNGAGIRGQLAACYAWLLDHDHPARWPRLELPCLVMSFEDDLRWPARVGREAAAAMKRGEFVAIDGIGHTNGLFDATPAIIRALSEFLTRHTPPAFN